jgi:hypothetical protein
MHAALIAGTDGRPSRLSSGQRECPLCASIADIREMDILQCGGRRFGSAIGQHLGVGVGFLPGLWGFFVDNGLTIIGAVDVIATSTRSASNSLARGPYAPTTHAFARRFSSASIVSRG